jgi:hypothetical protein
VSKPAQSLGLNIIYYVPVFYQLIQLFVLILQLPLSSLVGPTIFFSIFLLNNDSHRDVCAKLKTVWSYTPTPPYAIICTDKFKWVTLYNISNCKTMWRTSQTPFSCSICTYFIHLMIQTLHISSQGSWTHLLINLNNMSPLCIQWMRLISDLYHLETILLECHSQGNVSYGMFKMYVHRVEFCLHSCGT